MNTTANISLDDKILEAFQKFAYERGMTLSSFLRLAGFSYIEKIKNIESGKILEMSREIEE